MTTLREAGRESIVRDLILRVLVIPGDRYSDLVRGEIAEWDSLKHMELVFALEDRFGVRFDEAEFAQLHSPAAIARAIERHLAP